MLVKLPLVKFAVVPVTVTPEICVLKTPDTKLAVVPDVVVPVNEVKLPVV